MAPVPKPGIVDSFILMTLSLETSISFQAGDRVDCLNALSAYNDYLVGSYGAPNGCAYRSHHHPMSLVPGTDWVFTPLDGASFISGNQAAGFTGIDAGPDR